MISPTLGTGRGGLEDPPPPPPPPPPPAVLVGVCCTPKNEPTFLTTSSHHAMCGPSCRSNSSWFGLGTPRGSHRDPVAARLRTRPGPWWTPPWASTVRSG